MKQPSLSYQFAKSALACFFAAASTISVAQANEAAPQASSTKAVIANIHDSLCSLMVDPSPQKIMKAQSLGLISPAHVPYLATAAEKVGVSAETKASDITKAQTRSFIRNLKDLRLIATMSADTPEDAVKAGLPEHLAPFFQTGKENAGYKGAVDLQQAKKIERAVERFHWENIHPPKVKNEVVVTEGAILLWELSRIK